RIPAGLASGGAGGARGPPRTRLAGDMDMCPRQCSLLQPRTRPNVRLSRREHRHPAHAGARRLRYNYLLDPVDSGDLVLRQARDPSAAADSGLPGAVADACGMRGCMQRVESGVSAAAARLLIVDDEAAHMRALCDTLEREGYVTRGFTSGREALEALREQSFDLLLTDLQMPEIDGITLLRACQEIDRDIACVLMTGGGTLRVAGFTGPAPRALESAALKLGESAERWVEEARRELGARVAPSPAGVLFRHPFDPRIAVALPIVAGGKFFGVLGFSSSRPERRIPPGQLRALDVLARTAEIGKHTSELQSR